MGHLPGARRGRASAAGYMRTPTLRDTAFLPARLVDKPFRWGGSLGKTVTRVTVRATEDRTARSAPATRALGKAFRLPSRYGS
jgi:hypothetical protein